MISVRRSCLLVLLAIPLLFAACSSPTKETKASSPDSNFVNHPKLIEKFSASTKKYNGFHQTFVVNATVINSSVNLSLLNQRSEFLGWDEEKTRQEREKTFQEMSSYSRFFISFYSPENDYNDLNKPDSIWRIYLETNGQRYEGKVKKDTSKHAELVMLYPYYDRFRTPYYVSFEVPMSAVEQQKAVLTMTSSLGSASFEFPPVDSL